MKRILTILTAFVLLMGINACSEDNDLVLTQPDPAKGVNFTSTFSSEYILTNDTRTNPAERFIWNAVTFDPPTDVTYDLQGAPTSGFAEVTPLSTTKETNAAVTVDQMMKLAAKAGLDNDPETTVTDADGNEVANNSGPLYFRVHAYTGNGNANTVEEFSDVQQLTVVLPESVGEDKPVLPQLFLVGSATAPGWDNNNNNPPMIRMPDNESSYTYTAFFKGGGDNAFKLLESKGNWQPQWGMNNGGFISSDELGEDPGELSVAADGYYTVTVNKEDKTAEIKSFNASEAATYSSVGIIGSARPDGGWDAPDSDMEQSSFDPHIWQIKAVELIDGKMKFRANDAWDVSWGNNTELSGFGSKDNGPDIPVSGGTYDIWFNDLTGGYIFVPIQS